MRGPPRFRPLHFCDLAGIVLLASIFQAACTVAPTSEAKTLLRDYAKGGYEPAERYPTSTVQSTWTVPAGDRRISVRLTAPDRPGRFPLVVYLPGLGESTDDGVVWCNAWAGAGYVVLETQAEDHDSRVWQSDAARRGEFDALAREHFSTASLQQRLLDVTYVLSAARSRAASGDSLLRQADFGRIALAGFDLGAQTILAMAARASDRAGAGEPAIRAAIALSPYASSEPDSEWSRIRIPVLSITGTNDTDPYGRIASPALRRTPFQVMPAGGKYLLLLEQGTHETLSGTLPVTAAGELSSPSRRMASISANAKDAQRTRPTEGNGAVRESPRMPDTAENRAAASASVSRSTLRTRMLHMALVESTTLAFLDMSVKGSAAAKAWLDRDAIQYCEKFAQLQVN